MKLPPTKELWGVWDTFTNSWWTSPKGKCTWAKKNHAANAVNANPPPWMRRGKPYELRNGEFSKWNHDVKFSEQHRLVTKRIGLYLLKAD